jgi:hypothetical protein
MFEAGCATGAPPTQLSPATNDTIDELMTVLDWADVSGALSYDLQVSTASDFSSLLVDTTLFVSDFALSGLADSTLHYWRVNSLNGCGPGDWATSQFYVETCPIELTGDVNNNGSITSADIVAMVNFVFKGGEPPMPYPQVADVNCNGSVTSADIIYLVNFVFKSGPEPCDACTTL